MVQSNRLAFTVVAAVVVLLQGCAIPKRIATNVSPGQEGNDLALGCGPVPELEPYVYRIPTFQRALVVVAFDHLPTKETANVHVERSSGIKELDDAAVRTVAKWKCDLPPVMKHQTGYRVPFLFNNPHNPAPPAKLSIAWAGPYTAKSAKRVQSAASVTGFSTIGEGIEFGEESNQIQAKLGATFGVWLKAESVVPTDSVSYRYVWKFPSAGLVNPRTGIRHFSEEGKRTCEVGSKCIRGWEFTEDWERVPGTWTIEIWQEDKFIESRSFDVRLD